MASKVKENKKINKKRSPKKEVEIPVFVISKRERTAILAKNFSGIKEQPDAENFWIAKDKDNLPVLERKVSNLNCEAEGKTGEEKIGNAWQEIKKQAHQKNLTVSSAEKKSEKKGKGAAPLSERHKKTILWVGVTVIASLIFFIWIYNIRNSFSGIFDSASYTFSRSGGVLEEVNNSLSQFENQLSNLQNNLKDQSTAGADQSVVDQLKEKILVEELKNKLAK